jgi:hypothetical protein
VIEGSVHRAGIGSSRPVLRPPIPSTSTSTSTSTISEWVRDIGRDLR